MLIGFVAALTLASLVVAVGLPMVLIADWVARGATDWYRAKLEARLEAQDRAKVLCLPYVSWSDTVTHIVPKMNQE